MDGIQTNMGPLRYGGPVSQSWLSMGGTCEEDLGQVKGGQTWLSMGGASGDNSQQTTGQSYASLGGASLDTQHRLGDTLCASAATFNRLVLYISFVMNSFWYCIN